jgi:Fe2+ or Zn2+ uptake regulation protein
MENYNHDTLTRARKHLSDYGISPTVQRVAVVEYLLGHKTHPTVEAIHAALAPRIATLSRTTVYNTLSRLAEAGGALALDLDPTQTHYDGDTRPHAHFLCTRCGRIEDIFPDAAGWRAMLAAAPAPRGAMVNDVQLSYKGVCAGCAGSDESSAQAVAAAVSAIDDYCKITVKP